MPERPYCDRFIPSRRGTSLQDSFALLPDSPLSRTRDTPQDGAKDDNLDTYQMLLRSELLGGEPQQRRKSDEMTPTSLQGNLFRYRSVMQLRDDAAQFAVSPVGSDSQRVLSSPRRVPRKIPTVPYKVRECEGGGVSLHCLCTVSALSLHCLCTHAHECYAALLQCWDGTRRPPGLTSALIRSSMDLMKSSSVTEASSSSLSLSHPSLSLHLSLSLYHTLSLHHRSSMHPPSKTTSTSTLSTGRLSTYSR